MYKKFNMIMNMNTKSMNACLCMIGTSQSLTTSVDTVLGCRRSLNSREFTICNVSHYSNVWKPESSVIRLSSKVSLRKNNHEGNVGIWLQIANLHYKNGG